MRWLCLQSCLYTNFCAAVSKPLFFFFSFALSIQPTAEMHDCTKYVLSSVSLVSVFFFSWRSNFSVKKHAFSSCLRLRARVPVNYHFFSSAKKIIRDVIFLEKNNVEVKNISWECVLFCQCVNRTTVDLGTQKIQTFFFIQRLYPKKFSAGQNIIQLFFL